MNFETTFSLNVPVHVHCLNKNVHCINNFDGNPGPTEVEVAGDIEMAMSMAPKLDSVEVYEGTVANSVLAEIAAPSSGVRSN
jgi:hypothetical protein